MSHSLLHPDHEMQYCHQLYVISYNNVCFLGDVVANALPGDRLSQVTRRGMLAYTKGRSAVSLSESTSTYPPPP